jgi:hypothetical protein
LGLPELERFGVLGVGGISRECGCNVAGQCV